jgi:hypothetical protein
MEVVDVNMGRIGPHLRATRSYSGISHVSFRHADASSGCGTIGIKGTLGDNVAVLPPSSLRQRGDGPWRASRPMRGRGGFDPLLTVDVGSGRSSAADLEAALKAADRSPLRPGGASGLYLARVDYSDG